MKVLSRANDLNSIYAYFLNKKVKEIGNETNSINFKHEHWYYLLKTVFITTIHSHEK